MVSFAVRHVSDSAGGRTLASRRLGGSGGTFPTRLHFGMATSYMKDPGDGSGPVSVPVTFPDAKYDALSSSPTWTHHRFLGWFDAPGTPSVAGTASGSAVSASDSVPYVPHTVYGQWQLPATVTFDAATNGGTMPVGWTAPDYYAGQPYGALPVPTHPTLNFSGWYDGSTLVTSASEVVTGKTLVARYVAAEFSVDLAGYGGGPVWEKLAGDNPDPSTYDGLYRSDSVGQDGTTAWLKISVVGYTSFRILLRSYAESGYDYAVALDADETPEGRSPGYDLDGGSGVKCSLKSDQNSGTSVSDYTVVDYALDGGSHVIWVGFTKDSSYGEGDDRGYLLIPFLQGGGS